MFRSVLWSRSYCSLQAGKSSICSSTSSTKSFCPNSVYPANLLHTFPSLIISNMDCLLRAHSRPRKKTDKKQYIGPILYYSQRRLRKNHCWSETVRSRRAVYQMPTPLLYIYSYFSIYCAVSSMKRWCLTMWYVLCWSVAIFRPLFTIAGANSKPYTKRHYDSDVASIPASIIGCYISIDGSSPVFYCRQWFGLLQVWLHYCSEIQTTAAREGVTVHWWSTCDVGYMRSCCWQNLMQKAV